MRGEWCYTEIAMFLESFLASITFSMEETHYHMRAKRETSGFFGSRNKVGRHSAQLHKKIGDWKSWRHPRYASGLMDLAPTLDIDSDDDDDDSVA